MLARQKKYFPNSNNRKKVGFNTSNFFKNKKPRSRVLFCDHKTKEKRSVNMGLKTSINKAVVVVIVTKHHSQVRWLA